ncbi:undecaprenyl pyrophosphate synthetase [Chlamydia felis Fe/C-56]|uniref:Isoprenyl transferase n=1 Tax=Chlamydia felis (strain Fe/C-56) TaxID=264202 RepID=Q253D5_CHLFF|nr:isoprenyl transferase [Chlamydia felis]BAE81603.1 undecaprenyl pyrophosphate synthetase [Chlamydia felis Fe/C-56]
MSLTLKQADQADPSTQSLPRHVAIIMDGNRRWYQRHQILRSIQHSSGHHYGAKALPDIIESAFSLGIEVLTLFAFSTENFLRSTEEVEELFSLFHSQLDEQLPHLIENKIRLRCIGNLLALPKHLQQQIAKITSQTKEYSGRELVLAINYGGKDELVRAFKKLHQDLSDQKISLDSVSEGLIRLYLDTSEIPDPDLLIRTGGEMRVSNFLLWQIAYTELYVTDVLWPDFKPDHLLDAIKAYQHRARRGGR